MLDFIRKYGMWILTVVYASIMEYYGGSLLGSRSILGMVIYWFIFFTILGLLNLFVKKGIVLTIINYVYMIIVTLFTIGMVSLVG